MQHKPPRLAIEFVNFYPLGSDRRFMANSEQFVVLQECVEPCHIFIFVWRYSSRVFIAGSGVDDRWTAREADTLEIEALAERFNRQELREVLTRRAASGAGVLNHARAGPAEPSS